jgi:hypothetical protein
MIVAGTLHPVARNKKSRSTFHQRSKTTSSQRSEIDMDSALGQPRPSSETSPCDLSHGRFSVFRSVLSTVGGSSVAFHTA